MATGHQSPQSSLPPLSQKVVNTTTWGAGGNTTTITDEYIHPNSVVIVWVTGTVPATGTNWAMNITQGQVVLTSTDAESSTLALSYVVL
jgi:hypothetical protein